MAYDQPYQRALYSGGQLQEARKWHVDDYAAVIGGLSAADLQACCCPFFISTACVMPADLRSALARTLVEQLTSAPMPVEAAHARRRVVPRTPALYVAEQAASMHHLTGW